MAFDQTTQKFKPNIDQLYNEWIKSIDAVRSHSVIKLEQTLVQLLGPENGINRLLSAIQTEPEPQESRCHAFYRMIGFPVVNNSKEIYNPGLDIIKCKTAAPNLNRKILIGKNPIPGFDILSKAREDFFQESLKIFSNPDNINASTTALSSGGTQILRKFVSVFEDADPFNMKADKQKYKINNDAKVGPHTILLSDYKDVSGNKSNSIDFRKHIIKPFIVDARIELGVTPQSKLIAVPFVSGEENLKISSIHTAQRPLIEKFIRERQVIDNKEANTDKILNYIKLVPSITDTDLIKKVKEHQNVYKSVQDNFIDSLQSIRGLMHELAFCQKTIEQMQGAYYWVPLCSTIGPEGGCKVQNVFTPDYIDPQNNGHLVTDRDKEIFEASGKVVPNPIADILYYGVKNTNFTSETTEALGNKAADNLRTLRTTRERALSKAGECLRNIEIIMGEFSGFGLCDVMAITSALKVLPLENLLGFLDEEAYARMQITLPALKEAKRESNFDEVMKAFSELVKGFYQIMDTIYEEEKKGKK